jgi:hypothetical protein
MTLFGDKLMKKLSSILLAALFGTLLHSTHGWAAEEKAIDPASSRIIWGPTALPNDYKNVKLSSFNLGLWTIDYSPNSNITAGLQTAAPFGVYVIGGVFRGSFTLAPQVNLGFYGNAGTLGLLTRSGRSAFYYGGGPMLTIGDSRRALNLSVLTYGASYGRTTTKTDYVTLPGIGGSIQVSNRVKLNLEGYMITTPNKHKIVRAGAVLYGVRIFSEKGTMFGDISFLAPIYRHNGHLYKYLPMGIPILAFGFSF